MYAAREEVSEFLDVSIKFFPEGIVVSACVLEQGIVFPLHRSPRVRSVRGHGVEGERTDSSSVALLVRKTAVSFHRPLEDFMLRS